MARFMVLRVSKDPSDLRMTNYICSGASFDSVWNSQKNLFEKGSTVAIQDIETMEHKTYEL